MKSIAGLIALILVCGALGCSGNDKDRATQSSGSMPSGPESQGAAGAGVASAEQQPRTDAASSGGSSLAASTPYGKEGAVPQTLNPAPFLASSQPVKAANDSGASRGLVARSDGTMYGPNDLPAAGAGPQAGMGATGSVSSKPTGGTKTGTGGAKPKPANSGTGK